MRVGFVLMAVFFLASAGCRPDPATLRHDDESAVVENSVAKSEKPTQTDRLQLAVEAATRDEWSKAKQLMRQHLVTHPDETDLQQRLARIAQRKNEIGIAIEFLQSAIEINPRVSNSVYVDLAKLTMVSGQAFETVSVYERLVTHYPSAIEDRFALTGLASMLGLEDIAIEQLKWLAQHNRGDDEGLVVLAQPTQVEPDAEMCRKLLRLNPNDLRPHYGLAKIDAMHQRWREVVRRLEPVVERHPHFLPAYALYGRGLAEIGDREEILQWQRAAPEGVEATAQYWLAAGGWAERHGEHAIAVRAYYEAAKREEANNAETLTRLSRSLRQINRNDDAEKVDDRKRLLTRLHDATKTLYERLTRSQQSALDVADAMTELGRVWEAEAWARMALKLPDDRLPNAKTRYLSIRKRLTNETPWQTSGLLDSLRQDLADLPPIDWVESNLDSRSLATTQRGRIRFRNVAEESGLIHTIAFDPAQLQMGFSIYQGNGGGGAITDFDLDGWPDVVLAELNGSPMKEDSDSDVLFRNQRGVFVDVTQAVGLRDCGFSQGISSCDYNNDGFPDLCVANIGRNRLFQNKGDGTFEDVTDQAGLSGMAWTVSMAIADFDNDGHADLFDVNYCGGQRPFEERCHSRVTGLPTSCTPLDFEAEPDQVWQGVGDGTFREMTKSWLSPTDAGRGLGVVVANLDEKPGIDVFVANDMSSNHLWSPSLANADDVQKVPSFVMDEIGTARGVALSGRSFSQASMGIAQGDPDHDGDLDLFVTHFYDDYNTYYEQISAGIWADHSHQSELAEPSMKLLGFGTQFADYDNDGNLELIITNGHVSDLGRENVPYMMPAQLFRIGSDLRWEELDRLSLGDYFTKDHLGRVVATLDANRDGLNDVLITQLREPVALLLNESQGADAGNAPGNSIGLVLIAKDSQRDAVGAVIHAKSDDQSHYAQVAAGDGFMCSNQRRVSFGVGDAVAISDLTIDWPSGRRQDYGRVLSGADYVLVEGETQPFKLFDHHESLSPPVIHESPTTVR